MKYFDQALTDFPQAEAVAQTLREGGWDVRVVPSRQGLLGPVLVSAKYPM